MIVALKYLIIVVVGYFLGNFSTGLIVSKKQSGMDIRKYGSGNAGATNMLRVLGSRPALFTIIGDILKGWLAVGLGAQLAGFHGAIIGGTAAIIGHDWPIFFSFKGGKGVATTLGVGLLLFPWQGLVCLLVFVIVFLLTRYVSLGSLIGAFFCPILVCITHWGDWLACLASILWFLMIAFCHRGNIQRLLGGTENKIDLSVFKR